MYSVLILRSLTPRKEFVKRFFKKIKKKFRGLKQRKKLFGETGLNKLHESFNRLLFIGAAGDYTDIGAAHDTE